MALVQVPRLYQNGLDVGIGVAAATGSPMALGAVGDLTPTALGNGGTSAFSFKRVDTTEALESELGIGVDASGGVGLFSASASFDFSKNCKVQASSICVCVSALENFVFQQMDSPRLSDAAAALAEKGNTAQFAAQFGEYFVRGINTGGRFLGMIKIETQSSTAKTAVDAALDGCYGTIDAAAKVTFRETLAKAKATASAFIMADGGIIKTRPVSRDPVVLIEQLYAAMDEWTATVRTNAKAYSVTLAPYAVALGPPPPDLAQFEHQRDVLVRCAKLRASTMDKLNMVDYILDPRHAEEFELVAPPAGPDLPSLQASLAADLDAIAQAASFAINNIKDACLPEEYMRTKRGVPNFVLTPMPRLPPHVRKAAEAAVPPVVPSEPTGGNEQRVLANKRTFRLNR